MKQENNHMQQQFAQDQENPNIHHKLFMGAMIKQTPIGYQYHQIDVPQFKGPISPNYKFESQLIPTFLRSKTTDSQIQKYLAFVQSYFQQKIPDFFSSNNLSKERAKAKALQLLHSVNYNYTKAKFYILFPYYLTYNIYKCHDPINLSDIEMQNKINSYQQSLKSSKQNDLMKWIKTIQNQIESRIHISKINTYIEIAKQSKFQIPESIKVMIQKSVKFGKQLKRNYFNNKNTMEKLQTLKVLIQEQKIVTNEMIQFEEAISRAQDWIKKQVKFQQTYFNQPEDGGLTGLKKIQLQEEAKIQFRNLVGLVNQYNSLPIFYQSFSTTTNNLYQLANLLLQRLPSLIKTTKTRKAEQSLGVIKLSRTYIQQIIQAIEKCPVQHEEFISFQCTILDGLSQLEKVHMYLQDTRYQKSLKQLNIFQKLILDVPIQNVVQKKLQQKIQYYQLIQKIRKDILNPAKYQQLKEQIKKLNQKGYQTAEHAKLQSRVMACLGWHQSQQRLREDKVIPNRMYLLLGQKQIKEKMIDSHTFRDQLKLIETELNISDEILNESKQKLLKVQLLKQRIQNILSSEEPDLKTMFEITIESYSNGVSFPQLFELYEVLCKISILTIKMQFLLLSSSQILEDSEQFFFTDKECQQIIQVICQKKNQIKQLKTKQAGDQIMRTVQQMAFPKNLVECRMFKQFMKKGQQWSDQAMKIIQDFKNNDSPYNIRQLIDQSKYCLHSKLIQEQLNKIDIALKWRQKIAKKMSEKHENPFDQKDQKFIFMLEKDLKQFENTSLSQDEMMKQALDYMYQHGDKIQKILSKISQTSLENMMVLKLSEMNKFVKEVDRQIQKYQIEDKVIQQLKEKLLVELFYSDDWKERFLSIRRYQKKKMNRVFLGERQTPKKKQDDDVDYQNDVQNMKDQRQEENFSYMPKCPLFSYSPTILNRKDYTAQSQKRKFYIKNGQFCWYFRLVLMILEFYNGFKLKFVLEQLVKLKISLTQVYKFIQKYNALFDKKQKTDNQLYILETESNKFSIFFKQSYILSKKNAYIQGWKQLAQQIIKSVPIITMQLKARKPQELIQMLQNKKNQQAHISQIKNFEEKPEQGNNKRKRKPNLLYNNQDITLLKDELLNHKSKKKRKPNSDLDYRNPTVQNQKKYLKDQREQQERVNALLNRQIPPECIYIDDPEVYCICRCGVANQNSIMVECQFCGEWFHIECVGIKKNQAKGEQNYECVGCKSLRGEQIIGYYWDSHSKISQYALKQIYQEGKKLQVTTYEMKKIQIIHKAMMEWKTNVYQLLEKIVMQNPEDMKSYEAQLYRLYLHSLWLPTLHPEAVSVKKLVSYIKNH